MALKLLPGDVIHGLMVAPSIMVRQPNGVETAANTFGTASAEVAWTWQEADLSPDRTEIVFSSLVSPYIKRFSLSDMELMAAPGNLPTGGCKNVEYSPDGSLIALAHAAAPYVTIYERANMRKRSDFATSVGAAANALCFTKDGTHLIIGLEVSPFIAIYNLVTGDRLPNPTQLPAAGVDWVELSPDGSFVALSIGSSAIQYVYKTSDWSAISLGSLSGSLKKAKWNSDGSRLAQSTSSSPHLRIWDVSGDNFTARTVAATEASPGGGIVWLDDDTILMQTDTRYMIYNISTNAWKYAFTGYYPSTSNLGLFLYPGGARRKFAGSVKNGEGSPLSREIIAFDRESGRIIGKTLSDASTGNFELQVWSNLPAVVYAVGQGGETTELFDSVIPVPI